MYFHPLDIERIKNHNKDKSGKKHSCIYIPLQHLLTFL